MQITSAVSTKLYRIDVESGQKGGCHGQPRLSLHGIARHQPSILYALEWRSVLEALSSLEGNTLRARECKDSRARGDARTNAAISIMERQNSEDNAD